jgi:Protein of unknown function (DUF3592)
MKEKFDIQEYRNPKVSVRRGLLFFVGAGILYIVSIYSVYLPYKLDPSGGGRGTGGEVFYLLMGSLGLFWTGWQKALGVSKVVLNNEGICSVARLSKTFVSWSDIASVSIQEVKMFIGKPVLHLLLRDQRGKVLLKIASTMEDFVSLSEEVKKRAVNLPDTSDMSDQQKMVALKGSNSTKTEKSFLPNFVGIWMLLMGGLFTCCLGYLLYIQVGLYNGGTVTEATVTSSTYRNQTVAVEYRYRVPGDFIIDRCEVSHEEWKKVKEGEPFKVRYSTIEPRYSCYYKGKTYGSFMVTSIFFFVGLVMLAIAIKLFWGKKEKREKVRKKDGDFDPKGPLFE